jgi:pectinesterase
LEINNKITVSKDWKGDYRTIKEALNAIPDNNSAPVKIFIYNGIYEEKLVINKPYLTMEGESAEGTIITYSDYARMVMPDGELRGTFRTATVMIDTHNVAVKNITIRNEAGPGYLVGQAIALYVDGDRLEFDGCRIIGNQDTLFTGPLPLSPLVHKGFVGPKEHAPRNHGRQYFKDCYIEGNVDFIFGSATTYFKNCEIFTKCVNRMEEHENQTGVKGYITAPSTPQDKEYGYVFYECNFTSDCPPKTVYLGRPWRNYAKAVLIRCHLGAHIKEEGWCDWNKEDAHETVLFGEFESSGSGAEGILTGRRVPWSKQLMKDESLLYSRDIVYNHS